MATESVLAPPIIRSGPELADWAEAIMFIEKRSSLSRTALRRRLGGAFLGDDDDEDIDTSLELLLAEVGYRHYVASSSYPFCETRIGLSRRTDVDSTLYEFLLWLSQSPHFREARRFNDIEPLFDDVTSHALQSYLGSGAQSVVFAAASRHRPSSFREAVGWLADVLDLPAGAAPIYPKVKDGGVDVVAWKPFLDGRPGFAVLLCQTTVQRDWVPKAKDIVIRRWTGWIDFGWEPLTVLVVPFAVPRGFEHWDSLRRTVTIVLDRIRLCGLVASAELGNLSDVRNWCESERQQLGVTR